MSGSVSTRTANRQAERVTASGQLRLPVVLGGAAGEVEHRAARPRRVARRRSTRSPSRRLEHVLGLAHAVGERGEAARACAARSSRARRRWPRAGAPAPSARGELAQAQRAGAVGGELRAQVGAALARAGACARRARSIAALVERPRARSRRPPRRACGCRRASSPGTRAADVGVMGAARREADQLAAGVRRPA